MRLLRTGELILNMDQLIAIRDTADEMILIFGRCASEGDDSRALLLSFSGEGRERLRTWLGRMGVHDLTTETPGSLLGSLHAEAPTHSDAQVDEIANVVHRSR